MKIVPSTGPVPSKGEFTGQSAVAAESRARAIAILQSGSAQPSNPQAQPTPPEVAAAQAAANVSKPSEQGQNTSDDPTPQVPDAAPPAKTEEPISSQYAVLARKEKAFRAKVQAQEAALRAKEAHIAEREAQIKAQASTYETDYVPKQKLTENTVDALLDAGLTYDQITERFLAQQTPMDPQVKALITEMKAEIKALKGDSESTKKSITEQQQSSYNEAIATMKSDAQRLVQEFPEEYQAIKETDSTQDVIDLIVKTYEEDKQLLTVEEAAAAVEEELVERISKYAQLSKIQQKMKPKTPSSAPQTPVQTQQQDKQQQPAKTLTNNLSGTAKLSTRDRAILAFENKLGNK